MLPRCLCALPLLASTICLAESPEFRPPPQRPDYSALTTPEAIHAAAGYAEVSQQWERDLSDWKDQLSREDWDAYYDAHPSPHLSINDIPLIPEGYFWAEDGARKRGLSEEALLRLSRDNMLIEDRSWKQVFSVYASPEIPPFITSDSILNAFNNLLERSLVRLEKQRHSDLQSWLQWMWERLPSVPPKLNIDPELLEPGMKHARFVIGVAMRLLDMKLDGCSSSEQQLIEEEANRVRSGEGISLPEFLGPPTNTLMALDYSRFKPVGFFAGDPTLEQTFRAVRWLQSIPFRAERDNELIALCILNEDDSRRLPIASELLFGGGDSSAFGRLLCGFSYSRQITTLEELQRALCNIRKNAISEFRPGSAFSPIGDQLRNDTDATEVQYRIYPSYQPIDAKLWDRIRGESRAFSDGLDVAAMLGSGLARDALFARFPDSPAQIDQMPDGSARNTYAPYEGYMAALSSLFIADEAAPDLFRSEQWERKTINTALSGWAQMRHTGCLALPEDNLVWCISFIPPGFVEPNPEFFGRLADVEYKVFHAFTDTGLLDDWAKSQTPNNPANEGEGVPIRSLDTPSALASRWMSLINVTRRLESMAHKQLRGQDWDDDETAFIRNYADSLGYIMGYDGNSWEDAQDDSMRITTIGSDPERGLYNQVGIARARSLYVLYPWKGQLVLCLGAVMPFQTHVSANRMLDEEWGRYLDENGTSFPEWLQPLIVPAAEAK